MEKRAPKLKILVFPASGIDRVAGAGTGDTFAVQDIFSGHIVQQQGEGGGSSASPGFDSLEWQGQKAFDNIDKTLDFVRFMKDGSVIRGVPGIIANEGLGGWTIKAVLEPHNCIVTPPRENDPQPQNPFPVLNWRAVKGNDWETYISATSPYVSGIRHRSQQPDKALEIVSGKLNYPAGVVCELVWDGVFAEHTKGAAVRLSLIDKHLSVVWRMGGKPTVERWRNRRTGSGWEVWKRLDNAQPVAFKGRTVVSLQVLAGRLVLGLDDKAYMIMDTATRASAEPEPARPVESKWPEPVLRLSVYGVDVLLGVAGLSVGNAGQLQRTIRAPFSRSAGSDNTAIGYTGGWKPAGTSVDVIGTRGANSVSYTMTLASDRKKQLSPFVSNVMMLFTGGLAQEEEPPIDLRAGAVSVKYSSGEPDLMPTSEVQIELSRNLLDARVPNWQEYVKPFAPIRLLASWDYDDAGVITAGAWTRVFEGYIITPDKSNPDYNTRDMSLVARDPSIRLKAPAGFIDERYAPLDFLFAQKQGAPLYDHECVKYLLETELGSRIAGNINGNGNSAEFSAFQYPLLSIDDDRVGYFAIPGVSGISTQSGFMLPPEFGSDVYTWIHDKIAKANTSVFYWGYSPLAEIDDSDYSFGTQPLVPMYGRVLQIMDTLGATPKVLPDAIYLNGDANKLIGSASVETLTDKFYNEVVVWGARDNSGLFPSVFGGRARLPESDANSSEKSWRRVMLEQQDFYGTIGSSGYEQALAVTILREFEGVAPRNVSIVMPRGDETLRWGMKILPKMQASGSDLTLGINNETFRVKRVSHTWDLSGDNPERAFVTEIVARPLSASGF